MKILVVCQYYWPEPFRISDLCEALVERGHQVTVVTGTPNYPEGNIYPGYEGTQHRDEVIRGVRVVRCPIHPRKRGALHRFWNYYSFVFASKRCLSGLKEEFDVVFVNQLSPVMMAEGALQWARKHGKKCVLYCLDLWPESLKAGGIRSGSLVYRIFLNISRNIYRKADFIFMTSQGFAQYFQSVLGIEQKKLSYLPQYAEEQFQTLPENLDKDHRFHVLFAGNIGEVQSVETLVEAARRLSDTPEIHVDVVGDGITLEKCRQMAAGLTNITFHGRKDLSEMPYYYAKADVMAVTLKADPVLSLTLPGKVQSCLAAGKPVVGAIDGEARAVIQSADCGLCGPAVCAQTLAGDMLAMASQPEQLARWGENGRRYYREHFSKAAFLAQLEECLEEFCR